ncbi:hypothetical protein AVEN_233401-1 [Araneus ventricosus]|uniref:Uncharacterized protein n=1 Tax=Araneus ventricosus TaxID=182803 RepID=A0A4Y2DJY5_ARAVE|nr:hypothetical protein AVEN_233401-1 [Araneus ventricosus]
MARRKSISSFNLLPFRGSAYYHSMVQSIAIPWFRVLGFQGSEYYHSMVQRITIPWFNALLFHSLTYYHSMVQRITIPWFTVLPFHGSIKARVDGVKFHNAMVTTTNAPYFGEKLNQNF